MSLGVASARKLTFHDTSGMEIHCDNQRQQHLAGTKQMNKAAGQQYNMTGGQPRSHLSDEVVDAAQLERKNHHWHCLPAQGTQHAAQLNLPLSHKASSQ